MVGEKDISLVQSHILYEVEKRIKPFMQEVADALGTDLSTFSRQIQTLVRMELINKTPYEGDKRFYVLSLTDEGRTVAMGIQEGIEVHLNEIFSHLNEFERETVLRSMQLLNQAMAKSSVCCKPMF